MAAYSPPSTLEPQVEYEDPDSGRKTDNSPISQISSLETPLPLTENRAGQPQHFRPQNAKSKEMVSITKTALLLAGIIQTLLASNPALRKARIFLTENRQLANQPHSSGSKDGISEEMGSIIIWTLLLAGIITTKLPANSEGRKEMSEKPKESIPESFRDRTAARSWANSILADQALDKITPNLKNLQEKYSVQVDREETPDDYRQQEMEYKKDKEDLFALIWALYEAAKQINTMH